jgi:hypothetical protein
MMRIMRIMKVMLNKWLIVYCFWDGMEGEEILRHRAGEQDMCEFIRVGQQYVWDPPVKGLGQ